MTHPYFTDKAAAAMSRAGGHPGRSDLLTAWAERAHAAGDTSVGCVVADTGDILAETRRIPSTPGTCGGTYVVSTSVETARGCGSRVVDTEVSLAMAALTRITARPVIHVTYWDVCRGAATTPSA